MALDLTGTRALITGGTRGIGLATGLAFARRGARCALTYGWGGDDDAVLAAFEAAGAARPLLIQADVCVDDDTSALMETLGAELGGVDVFVSNVAMGRPAQDLMALQKKDLLKAVGYSAWPLIGYTQALIKAFGRPPRYIVGISSFGGLRYHPGYDTLGAAKATLETLAAYLAHHLHPEGCRVNIVRAGYVHTQAFDSTFGKEAAPLFAEHAQLLKPEEIADAALALCSGWMDGLTGQVLNVDRGLTFYDNPMHRYAQQREETR